MRYFSFARTSLVYAGTCLLPLVSLAQSGVPKVVSEAAREIVVEASGIHAVSANARDTIVIDLDNNSVIYSYPVGVQSFWYKIFVKKDCEVSFEIFPAEENNRYNYFLYKATGDLTVADVKTKNIYPVRANLFVHETENSGTGLAPNTEVSYNDTGSVKRAAQFYHTAYHGAVPVLSGDVLLLNIYHLSGDDCGQQLILRTNEQSQAFQSLYSGCYWKRMSGVKTERIINLRTPPKPIVKPAPVASGAAKASYQVWDSLKHSPIEAELVWSKKQKNSNTTVKGSGEIILQPNTYYFLTFSAVGYKSKNVSFLTKDTLSSFTRYVFLTPVKVGENFSMDKIYFYPNTYAMRPEAPAELNKLLKYLKSNTGVHIEIQGYTNGNNRIRASPDDFSEGSFTGSAKKLSKKRAEMIRNYLVENGVAEDRLVANGYGGSAMIYEKPRNQEEANKNIRVGIQILGQSEGLSAGSAQKK